MNANHARPPHTVDGRTVRSTLFADRVSRRTLLRATIATPMIAALLAACGDDTKGAGSNPPESTAGGATTTPTGAADTTADITPATVEVTGIDHPTGADDVILRLGYEGGFVRPGYAFTSVPTTLISGDRHLIRPGVTTAIFPGPLLPALTTQPITEAGIQTILAAAQAAQLLQTPPDYFAEVNVADVPDTTLRIDAAGGSFLHRANALGFDEPTTNEARARLAAFTTSLGDIVALVGAENLGEESVLEADNYRMQARPMTDADMAGYTDPVPTVVPWPGDIGVALVDAAECALVDAAKVGSLFADANEMTFFTEGDITYQIAVVAELPGDTC